MLASLQGILRAQIAALLTPAQAIGLLHSSGSPQQSAADRPNSQRIGNRPDLAQLIPRATKVTYSNRLIRQTFTSHHSRNAWANIQGLGCRKILAGSKDGVSNCFVICCEAMANQRRVTLQADNRHIYHLFMK